MKISDYLSTPNPKTLEDLLSEGKYCIRLIGELHPNRHEPSIIMSLRLLKQLFDYIERFEEGRSGALYGRREDGVEITGFDVPHLDKQQDFFHQYGKSDKKLGAWLAQKNMPDDAANFFLSLPEGNGAELILLLPIQSEQLIDEPATWGFWNRKKKGKNSGYEGPFGYFLYDAAAIDLWEKQAARRKLAEKPVLSLMDKMKIEPSGSGAVVVEIKDSGTLEKPKERQEPKRVEKHTIMPPKTKTVIEIKNSEKTTEPAPDIRITKDEIERAQSFSFLEGYNCYHPPYYEISTAIHGKLKEADESIFIPRKFINDLLRYPRSQFDDNVIANLLGKVEPSAERRYINYVVNDMDFLTHHEPFSKMIKHVSWFLSEVFGGEKRSKFRPSINSWIHYTSRARIGLYRSSFDVYQELLKQTRRDSEQLGVIVIDKHNVENRRETLDPEAGLEMCAFITRANSNLTQYFPPENFFIYQRKG